MRKTLVIGLNIALITALFAVMLPMNVSAYNDHAPISINGNSEFTAANGVTGGSGTQSDPYIIEDWEIDGEHSIGNGILIQNTDAYFVIQNCYVHHCGGSGGISGIVLDNVKNGMLRNNICSNNDWSGIRLLTASDNIISDNTCPNNFYGVFLWMSSDNTIEKNTCSNNRGYGVSQYTSNDNIIKENSCVNNGYYGVFLYGSNENTIERNTCSNTKFYAGIYLSLSKDNTISANTCSNNVWGIWLSLSSTGNTISGNTCLNNGRHGIQLYFANGNTIQENTLSENNWNGMFLFRSHGNSIEENMFTENSIRGIILSSSNSNTITSNTASENTICGISLKSSKYNDINGNTVLKNEKYGLYLDAGTINNELFHNNIIDNVIQIEDNGDNSWDNGAGEGNYWSDYEGLDDGSNGRMAGDGIGDTDLPHQDVDNYPLMYQWAPPIIVAIEHLIDDIKDMELPKGLENSFVSKLDNAIKSLEKGNYNAAVNQLNAFIKEVEAQRGKKITEDQADYLIAKANWILSMLT